MKVGEGRREHRDKAVRKQMILNVTSDRSWKTMLMCVEISAFEAEKGSKSSEDGGNSGD